MPEPMNDAIRPDLIYLVGTSGHPNFGDELVTAEWLRHLARVRPEATVVLDCPQPGLAAFLFEGLHPRLLTTDLLFRVIWETRDLPPEHADPHVDRVLRDLGSPRYDFGLLAARRATQVHVLGGGYINAIWPFHVGLLRAALRLGELSGAPVAATGLGLVPSHDPDAVRDYLQAFAHATVRDDPSAEIAGVPAVADDIALAFGGLPGFQERPSVATAPGEVWVCLQSDLVDEPTRDSVVAATRDLLVSEPLQGRTVRYLEAMPGGDRVAFDLLGDLVPAEHFVPFVDLWRTGFPGRPGQTWLTTRSHLHLLAAASGADGVAFCLDQGHRAEHEALVAAGTGWTLAGPAPGVPGAPALSPDFRLLAARMHARKADEASRIYPSRAVHRAPARGPGLTP